MAKEVFERNSTGHKVIFFHWKNASENEDLLKFLGEDFSIQLSTLRYKGLCFPLQAHSYFYKSDIDDGWDLLFPEGMIKEYSYIGEVVAEEASEKAEEVSEKKEIEEARKKILGLKEYLKNTFQNLSLSDSEKFYLQLSKYKEAEEICINLEDNGFKIDDTESCWNLAKEIFDNVDKKDFEIIYALSDFDFEFIEDKEEVAYEIFDWLLGMKKNFDDENEKKEPGETWIKSDKAVYTKFENPINGILKVRYQYWKEGNILNIDFSLIDSEYNCYY